MFLITIFLIICTTNVGSFVLENNSKLLDEIDFNNIDGDIYTGTLRDLISVKQLTIRNSVIIENIVLCLIKVQQLNLYDNWQLPKLTQDRFVNCTNLEILKIVNNHDLIIEDYTFSTLINLKDLLISNQSIKKLTRELLMNLTNLENLRMRFCGIQVINSNTFDDLINLQTLELVFNKFKTIGDSLINLNKLKILDLSNNKLNNFNWDNLQNLTNLNFIYLSWNNIRNFNVDSMMVNLGNVKVLEMEMNPVGCEERTLIFRKLSQLTGLDLYINVYTNGTCVESI